MKTTNRVRTRRPSLETLETRALLSTVPLTVTTLADDPIKLIPGQTTLRDAITQANAAGVQTINIAAYGELIPLAALPNLTGNVTIAGPSSSGVTIQTWSPRAGSTSLIVAKGASVNLSGVTLFGGNAHLYGKLAGHCVDNFGRLTMNGCTVTEDWGHGAVVNEAGGNLELINCTFSNNVSNFSGAAVSNYGNMDVSGGMFVYNVSAPTLNAVGGAISNYAAASVHGATFSHNSAHDGGAIYNQNELDVYSCTFDNNHADGGDGGAIYNHNYWNHSYWAPLQMAEVSHCVFASNSASVRGGAIANMNMSGLTLNADQFSFTGRAFSFTGRAITGYDVYNEATLDVDLPTVKNMGAGFYNNGTWVLD